MDVNNGGYRVGSTVVRAWLNGVMRAIVFAPVGSEPFSTLTTVYADVA